MFSWVPICFRNCAFLMSSHLHMNFGCIYQRPCSCSTKVTESLPEHQPSAKIKYVLQPTFNRNMVAQLIVLQSCHIAVCISHLIWVILNSANAGGAYWYTSKQYHSTKKESRNCAPRSRLQMTYCEYQTWIDLKIQQGDLSARQNASVNDWRGIRIPF